MKQNRQLHHDKTEIIAGGSTIPLAFSSTETLSSLSHLSFKYRPWIIVLLCSAFLFYKFVLQVSPSVMAQDLMRTFHINGAGLGNLAATYFYAYLAAQLFVGPLLDRYSPRIITALAIGTCAVGTIAFASSKILLFAELSRALVGIGAAFATVSYMKMTSLWFKPNQMAFVDGLLATAAMTGALCGQVPLAYLVTNHGWQDSLSYCGALGIVFAFLFLIIVRDKRESPLSIDAVKNPNSGKKLKEFLMLLQKRENWILTLYSGLAFTPVAVLGGLWGNPFFVAVYHLKSTQAASFTSCIFLGLALGGPIFGLLADRIARVKIMKLGTMISLLTLVIVIYSSALPLWLLGSLLFMFGFGTGAFMSCFALGKEFNDIKLTATVISLINTGDALFGSFTEPLIGKILDYTWTGTISNGVHQFTINSFRYSFSILPLYIVAALIFLFMLKDKKEQSIC